MFSDVSQVPDGARRTVGAQHLTSYRVLCVKLLVHSNSSANDALNYFVS